VRTAKFLSILLILLSLNFFGVLNKSYADSVNPQILYVSHSPKNPNEKQQIKITAKVIDDTGIANVTLFYRKDFGQWNYTVMQNEYLDKYFTKIGPFYQGTYIEYYIKAIDNSEDQNTAIEDNNGSFYKIEVCNVFDNSPPIIENVTYNTNTKNDKLTISVFASIFDNSGILEAKLCFRINYGSWKYKVMEEKKEINLYYQEIGPINLKSTEIIEFFINATDNSVNHNWKIADNGDFYKILLSPYDRSGPTIYKVSYFPASPTNRDAITIQAIVEDKSGLNSVILFYYFNKKWTRRFMEIKNENTFQTIIGPFDAGDVISFYIKAVDNSIYNNVAIDNNGNKYYEIIINVIPDRTTIQFNFFLFSMCIIVFLINYKKKYFKKLYRN